MNALAKESVGKYLNIHFISAFQKVATFQIANGQKQGGNVASYFCTPGGFVLHAVAGPVNEETLLREAHWAVETYNLAMLERMKTVSQLRAFMQKAHVKRLQMEHGLSINTLRLTPNMTPKSLARVVEQQGRMRGLNNQGQVHLLLSVSPLPRIEQIYQIVFEKVLNEKVSTSPVRVAGK